MPAGKGRYTVGKKGSYGCNGYPVVGGEGKVHGCHPTRSAAFNQQAAIYASENQASKSQMYLSLAKALEPIEAIMEKGDQQMDWAMLTDRQKSIAEDLAEVVLEHGMFDRTSLADGSHYTPAELNPFIADGIVCKNCIFYSEGNGQCQIVVGPIAEEDICKFWIIPNEYLLGEEAMKSSEPQDIVKSSDCQCGGDCVCQAETVEKSLNDVFAKNLPKTASRTRSTGNGEAPFTFNL